MTSPQTQTQTRPQKQAPWTNTTQTKAEPRLGLDDRVQQDVVNQLEQVLIDTYTVYTKTQNAHWNVTGPMFHPLHALFEEQYQEMFEAVDTIAERIRTLGRVAPATFKTFIDRSAIAEWNGPPKADAMLADLVKDHETIVGALRELSKLAQDAGDEATVDLAGERLRAHEKHAWMLRVHLE